MWGGRAERALLGLQEGHVGEGREWRGGSGVKAAGRGREGAGRSQTFRPKELRGRYCMYGKLCGGRQYPCEHGIVRATQGEGPIVGSREQEAEGMG